MNSKIIPIALICGSLFVFYQKGTFNDFLSGKTENSSIKDVEFPIPPQEYLNQNEVLKTELSKNKDKAAHVAASYLAFSDFFSRLPEKFNGTVEFKEFHTEVLKAMFKDTGMVGGDNLAVAIDNYLQKWISLQPKAFSSDDREKIKYALQGIAYTANQAALGK